MTQEDPQWGDTLKAAELIRGIRVGLLTTVDRTGLFHTRPLETLQVEPGEALWFFTGWSSPKVDELLHDRRVTVGYADPGRGVYVAVGGMASLLKDRAKTLELWRAEQRAYYPSGPDDERLALLRVGIEQTEYWIAPDRTAYWIAAARATVSGKPREVIGEDKKIRS